MRNILFLCLFTGLTVTLPAVAFSSGGIGAGFTSTTSGRMVPALSGFYFFGQTGITAFATGVKIPLYYHSGYLLNVYKIWNAGKFLGGKVVAGFGGGVYYGERGYRETPQMSVNKSTDFDLGPAAKISWSPFNPLYLSLDGMFGLKNLLPNLTLAAQDVVLFSIGIEL